ncbi:MAG TPA: CopD family protein [Candidatus Udaeobacter sp.]|jgi:copper resistance protein D|nr:CopD family protein [Candidatus Udaeobacter sp.]
MARLLQIFGFLSVLFRGATLTFQSLTAGGIAFLCFVLRRADEESDALRQACFVWIRRSASALAAMQIAYVLSNSLILMQSAHISFREASGANFVIAGAIGLLSTMTVMILTKLRGSKSYAILLLPAAAIIASTVMTSHAMARLEYRAPLVSFTALHQAATAAWLGGLPYLLIVIRRAVSPDFARQLSARFSQLALASVVVLGGAGMVLGYAYVGSIAAVYGTSYGAMVATKASLFGLLLFLGALNYQLVRRGPTSSILASLKRFGETEIGIGVTVILTAASLTSLPPAVDLSKDRVTRSEIFSRMVPRPPRLASPTIEELPEDIYVAQSKAFQAGSLSTESYVPGQAGTRPNTPAEKAWSEYNHHWAGIIVVSIGLLAVLAQAASLSWARNWPLLFLSLALFLFLRSDPEVWPLGPNGFWVTFADPEVLMHRIFVLVVIGLAVFEWRVQTGRVSSARVRLIFPMLVAVSGALLLTHSHSLGNIKEEVLAELSHIPIAILAVTAGWSRWLELRLPSENRIRHVMSRLWPVCVLLIGVLLLNYREM